MAANDYTTLRQFKTFLRTAGKTYTPADIGSLPISAGLEVAYIQLKKNSASPLPSEIVVALLSTVA